MVFEWDEEKNNKNKIKHNIAFECAVEIFDGFIVTSVDDRFDYKEVREKSVGVINNEFVIVVIHTHRGDNIRIISARIAKRKEKDLYYKKRRKNEN